MPILLFMYSISKGEIKIKLETVEMDNNGKSCKNLLNIEKKHLVIIDFNVYCKKIKQKGTYSWVKAFKKSEKVKRNKY